MENNENMQEEMQESIDMMRNFNVEPPKAEGIDPMPAEEGNDDKPKPKAEEPSIAPIETEHQPEETPAGNDRYYNEVYDSWRELGFLHDAPELEKDRVLTNDDLISIIEENNRNAAKKMFEDEFMSKFDDNDAREYLNYVLNGGSSADFFKQRMESPAVGLDGDITNSSVQDNVIATYLSKFAGLEQGEIAEQIQMLTDAGKKEKYARMYLDKIHQYDEAQRESMKRESEMREKQERENYQRVVQSYDAELKNTESIFGVRCDDRKRSRLMDMMFKPVRMQDGSVQTEFNIKLYQAMQNPKTAIVLADLLANDFDVKRYTKSLETEATRKIRAGLNNPPKR
jgi:hypothetical protein